MKHNCEHCKLRKYAEKNPETWFAKLWRWHTTWCPGWKAYMRDAKKTSEQDK